MTEFLSRRIMEMRIRTSYLFQIRSPIKEFPFDLIFQPVGAQGTTYSLLYLLPVETRTLLSGPRKARMLVRGKEGIQAMVHSSETFGVITQLKRQKTITLAGLVHTSLQQVQGLQSSEAGCSQQLIPRRVCQPSRNLLRQIETRDKS